MYKKYSILNDKAVSGIYTLENTESGDNYLGILNLCRGENNKISSRILSFNLTDKEEVKDLLQLDPDFATCTIEVPPKIVDLYNVSIMDVLKSIFLALLFTLFIFIATILLRPLVEIRTFLLGDYVAASDIIFLLSIAIKKLKAPKIYDKVNNIQDNLNLLREYSNMIKVYLAIRKDILLISPFIGGMVNTIRLVSNEEGFHEIKESKDVLTRKLFDMSVLIDGFNYNTEVISSNNILYVYIKPMEEQDFTQKYISYEQAAALFKNNKEYNSIKMSLRNCEIVML
jgi:hypothetical protein